MKACCGIADVVRCRYTREECEEPALYKVGKCDLCFVAEEARGDIPRVDRPSSVDRMDNDSNKMTAKGR